MVATFCQYEALKYVSFPVQTLGKCAKMIPVMIWGSAVNGKTYKAKDYIVALAVTAGCAMFAMTGAHHNSDQFQVINAGSVRAMAAGRSASTHVPMLARPQMRALVCLPAHIDQAAKVRFVQARSLQSDPRISWIHHCLA